jgi:hypothetical protein
MAGSFVAAADGHGGTPVTEAQPGPQPLLTHPRGDASASIRPCLFFILGNRLIREGQVETSSKKRTCTKSNSPESA